ncbi:TetR/AcrR family transcriptional regulator [Kutzneria sp. NPDC052558]|uniref:TetR/AcrR family transcriptional regulator n=1 Tax=Kutzneria sp. NPDC052558 TaxID=3364121 RepID=UPI0037C883B2
MPPSPNSRGATSAGRRAPGRPAMPREQIVAAALAILDEEGADALSLRALAQRLESSTATLYRHFDSRADLLAQVVDRIFGEIDVDPEQAATWQDACGALAAAMFEVLRRHRNAAPLIGEHVPVGPNALLHRERALALLLAAGFSPALAARAYSTLARHVLGFAMQLNQDAAAQRREDTDVSARLHRLDPDRFPATVAVADALPVALEDEFEFGLRLIITGLEAVRTGDARA